MPKQWLVTKWVPDPWDPSERTPDLSTVPGVTGSALTADDGLRILVCVCAPNAVVIEGNVTHVVADEARADLYALARGMGAPAEWNPEGWNVGCEDPS